jgi:hypothetical protein
MHCLKAGVLWQQLLANTMYTAYCIFNDEHASHRNAIRTQHVYNLRHTAAY